MALTHRLFGMRSCNEVICSKLGPALPRNATSSVVSHPARQVRSCNHWMTTDALLKALRLFLEGRNDELVKTLRARMLGAAEGERFEVAA